MLDYLQYQVKRIYFENDQVLNLEALYYDDERSFEQWICLIEENSKHCTFHIQIRTFGALEFGEAGSKPYLMYEPDYNTFLITIPKFGFLTDKDIEKAVRFVLREYFWYCLNFKIKKEK
jgi:hypothetical protein